ncbi:MAG: fimbrillin family protein, partial [Muribaculaceae bacterium]|nr:fimbrillin family protein [Muribaculaceae bacterium]
MKKTKAPLMMAVIAAMALASCSQDEPVSANQGRAIDFRAAMDSRATETTNANLTSIKAVAFMGNQLF